MTSIKEEQVEQKLDTVSQASSIDQEKGGSFEKPFVKSEAEKRFVRKITFTVMPFVAWILMLQVHSGAQSKKPWLTFVS